MSRDEATAREEQLAALLAAYDDALATGQVPPGDSPPPEVRPLVEDNLECLFLLHQLRPTTPPHPAPHQPGESIAEDRYTLDRLHALGGIGQVWLAYDADLGRDVALKELRPERVRNPAIAARFLREARITSLLQHPGIVPVYELVANVPPTGEQTETAPPFYTMRFVQGRTLTDAARAFHEKRAARKAGPLDLAELLNAFVSVCNTVAYAHSRGVIHRDLKGQNVVLGDFGEVMVLDWGFAKVLGGPEEDELSASPDEPIGPPDQTIVGQVLGTPIYMSPEQAEGRQDLIDARSDVYGLGAMLYEILTGLAPIGGGDTAEVLRRVRQESPRRPETIWPGVPRALAAVCMKALSRNPAERYPSAADLGREVQHWLADEPVTAYRDPLSERLRRWSRRHKPVVTALAALIATGLTALSLGQILLEQEQARTDAARVQAAADKAEIESRGRRALETRLYYHRIALAERELAEKNLNRATQLLAACAADLRGWEWYCLDRLRHVEPLVLRGHSAAVSAVAFRVDGLELASASHDGTVRLWNTTTGAVNRVLTGHKDAVYGLAYSPDGAHLATASWDQTVRIWDVATGRELLTFKGHEEQVLRVVFSPDGKRVASLSSGMVLVWDAATGENVRTLGSVGGLNRYGLAWSPDGQLIAVTTHEPNVILFEAESGLEMQVFRGHQSVVKNVAFSPDSRLVASGAGDLVRSEPGEVKVWEASSGQEIYHLRGHTDPIYGVTFNPVSRRLASASLDQTVKIWDLATGQEALTLRAHTDTVRSIAFSADGARLASASADGVIKIWDANPWIEESSAYEVRTLPEHGAPVFSIAWCGAGQRLAALSDNETIRTWDIKAGTELENRRLMVSPQIYALALSADESLLATATTDGLLWLFNPSSLESRGTFQAEQVGPVKGLAFSPDGRWVAVASWHRTILIWEVTTGRMVHTLEGHADAVVGVAFSPDGKRLASASFDHTVRIWDTRSGELLHTLHGHQSRVFGVAYRPDGKQVASASNDGTIRLWNADTGASLGTLQGHASGVLGVAFSPDSRQLASAGNDWTVKLWDATTGTELRTLRGHLDRVHAVAFSPDGSRLASASSDRTVKIWDVLEKATPGR